MMSIGVVLVLISSAAKAQSTKPVFAPPESASTCTAARSLAGQVDGKLDNDVVASYELHALTVCRKELGNDHLDTLTVMVDLAISYGSLGQHEKALPLKQEALQLLRVKLGDKNPATLGAMHSLGSTYDDLGQHTKALELQLQTLQLRTEVLGADHLDTLSAMNSLADTYGELGLPEKALSLQIPLLKMRRAALGEDHPSTLNTKNNLAKTYDDLGQYDKAVTLNEDALALRRAKLGVEHPETLRAMNNLAVTYVALGQYDKALALNEQTLQLRRAKLGDAHPQTLSSMANLASNYSYLEQFTKALALHEQTFELMRANLGQSHPNTLVAMNNLAATYTKLGQHTKALTLKEQTLEIRRVTLGQSHPSTLTSMNNLANTYIFLGQPDRALQLNEQALQLQRARLGTDHPDTLRAMNNLAVMYYTNRQESRALTLVTEIQRGSENLRASDLSAENKQSIFAEYSNDYQRYSSWYSQQAQIAHGFDIGDLSKARSLTDSIRGQTALEALSPEDRARLLDAQSQIQTAQKNYEQINDLPNAQVEQLLAARQNLNGLIEQFRQFQSDIVKRSPKYAQLISLAPASVSQAKDLLADGELFISYLVRSDGAAQVYLLGKDAQVKWVKLDDIVNLSSTVAAYRDLTALAGGIAAVGDVPSPAASVISRAAARAISTGGKLFLLEAGGYQWITRGQANPTGAKLVAENPTTALLVLNKYWYEALIKPILPVASQYKRWIISPDKDLALLPFDTMAEEFNAAGETSKLIAQSRNISIVQSFAVYVLLKQREKLYAQLPRVKDLMAMGNAIYADGWSDPQSYLRGDGNRGFETSALDRAGTTLTLTAERYAITQGTWKNLPGTAREVMAVARTFGFSARGATQVSTQSGDKVDVFTGQQASEAHLLALQAQGKLKDYRYLLFSAHGYLAQNPSLSALVLTQKGNLGQSDGYITAGEWPLYDVRSDLTVLSACDTGVGRTQAGEGVMGLPYALFIAGNKNTLLSLWPVDDDATAEFMSCFFAKLKAGQTQPEALSQTKREFMQQAKWSAPKYWAAFVLYGV